MNTRVDPLIGLVLNERYRIDAKIARGGMAMVYRGTDLRLDREIAIKVMHDHLITDENFVERFRREAINAGRLTHPNLVAIHDQSRDGDAVYLVMEYLPSVTLRKELKHRGTFTPRQAIVVLDAILAALEAVHSTGIIHRDLKPDNVLLGVDGQVKLADFGLARAVTTATTTKTLIGTVGYVAPELVTRTGADVRTDLYTVGIMFYEMLTGAQPYTDEVPIQVAYRHVHDTVPPPSHRVPGLSPRLDALVLWLTSKDPDDRPEDATQIRNALAEARSEMDDAELDLGAPAELGSEHAPALTASILDAEVPKEKKSRTDEIPYLDEDETQDEVEHNLAEAVPPTGANDDSIDATGSAVAGTTAGAAAASPAAADSTVGATLAERRPTGPRRRRRRRLALTVLSGLVALCLIGWLVIVNLPAPTVVVPAQLAGQPAATVTSQLKDAGLRAETATSFDPEIPAGQVIGTDPVGGSELPPDSVVTVTVSKGEQLFAVPKLPGLSLDKARAALEDAHLEMGKTTEDYSDTVEDGAVISASEKEGKELAAGAKVDLVVSKGQAPIPVPDVEGLSYDAAFSTLAKHGFRVGKEEVFSDSVPKGDVVFQWPKSSESKPYDSLIIVRVSKGPEKKDKKSDKDTKKSAEDGKDSKDGKDEK